MDPATPKKELKTRCAQIYADDYAALNARRSRTGAPIVRQIHDAVVLLCGSRDAEQAAKPIEKINQSEAEAKG